MHRLGLDAHPAVGEKFDQVARLASSASTVLPDLLHQGLELIRLRKFELPAPDTDTGDSLGGVFDPGTSPANLLADSNPENQAQRPDQMIEILGRVFRLDAGHPFPAGRR